VLALPDLSASHISFAYRTAKESSKNNLPVLRRNVVRIQGAAKGA
jgi:hypothetical protein